MTDQPETLDSLKTYVTEALTLIAQTLEQQDHRINAAVKEAETARDQYAAMMRRFGMSDKGVGDTMAPSSIRAAIGRVSRESAERMNPKRDPNLGDFG